ncbi:MAG TPA: recombinase family protein [Gammaproteobacteria bacterium]|nr:recombinase family protein [Gammaproteobacteria bacterium]
MADKRRNLRCAIYTRKSSDEGLEQDFNSLDAQREACEAYITSQRHGGWSCLPNQYDDGGISGATLERPALQRLLADVKARKIDVIVVYKVDRLTRALADFAKIVEIFDAHKVSFVSVTQQFNTTSSMGRLTLNVLLSFAQFEREVTAERIRDKIAASKKKGMWMGGNVPLGYDAKDRTLVINETEAETVRTLFRLYLELGNVRELQTEATKRGLRSKTGRTFAYGHLYHLLENPIYIGRIRHKKTVYDGQHPAIIDQGTWDAVQAQLGGNRVRRRNGNGARNRSPLAGRLFNGEGNPFTPTHAVKNGKRYRYYVERKAAKSNGEDVGARRRYRRIAASEIEGVLFDRLQHILQTPSELLQSLEIINATPEMTARAIAAGSNHARQLANSNEGERSDFLRKALGRVTLFEQKVELDMSIKGLRETLGIGDDLTASSGHTSHHLEIMAQLKNRGVELKLVVSDSAHCRPSKVDPTLLKALVKATAWLDMLLADDGTTINSIAKAEGVTGRYVRRILELAFLAPDITQMVLEGRQPAHLSTEWLVRGASLPLGWRDQRQALGL